MRKVFWYSISLIFFLAFAYVMTAGLLSVFALYSYYFNHLPLRNGLDDTLYSAALLILALPLRQIVMWTSKQADHQPSTQEQKFTVANTESISARPYTKG